MPSSLPSVAPPSAAPPPRPPGPSFAGVLRREVSVGSLVSRTFSVWAKNVGRFALVTFVVFLPFALVGVAAGAFAALSARGGAPSDPAVFLKLFLVLFPLVLVVFAVQMGGLTYGALQHLGGRPVRLGSMLGAGFRRSVPLVAALFLAALMFYIGLILLIVPGVIVGCGLAVVLPAVVAERIGPVAAIKRSWALTRGYRLTVFAAGLVVMVANLAVNMFVQFAVPLLVQNMGAIAVVIAIPAGIAMLLMMSLPYVLPAVAYHDLRVAKEGVATGDLLQVFE